LDTFFTLLVGLLYSVYTVIFIRVKRTSKYRRLENEEKINQYKKKDYLFLVFLIFLEITLIIAYVFKLKFLLYFNINIPFFIRLISTFMAFFGVFLIGWASFTLDGEYSNTIEIKENHRLVRTGPYKYIRHPIYLGFIFLHIGITIMLSNIFILISYNLGLILLLIERIPKEERVLKLYFGRDWELYCEKTNRFLPKFFEKK